MVESGRVRVRSYAVEEAVSKNVTLHDETVQVDRRVVDRAVTPGDEALFADKVIEATEMREQAVVSKDARVVGEVGIRKDATQRTETVSDKVRHTEVEVEDGRGNVSRTGTTGTTTTDDPAQARLTSTEGEADRASPALPCDASCMIAPSNLQEVPNE